MDQIVSTSCKRPTKSSARFRASGYGRRRRPMVDRQISRLFAFEFRTNGTADTLVKLKFIRESNPDLPMREYGMSAAAKYMWRSIEPSSEYVAMPGHAIKFHLEAHRGNKDVLGLIHARLYLDWLDEKGWHCQQCIDWIAGTQIERERSYKITDSDERFKDL